MERKEGDVLANEFELASYEGVDQDCNIDALPAYREPVFLNPALRYTT